MAVRDLHHAFNPTSPRECHRCKDCEVTSSCIGMKNRLKMLQAPLVQPGCVTAICQFGEMCQCKHTRSSRLHFSEPSRQYMLSATDTEPWVKHVFLDSKEEKSCLLPPTVLMPPLRLKYALERTSTDRNSYPMSLQKWGATDKIKAEKLDLINQVTRGFGGGI